MVGKVTGLAVGKVFPLGRGRLTSTEGAVTDFTETGDPGLGLGSLTHFGSDWIGFTMLFTFGFFSFLEVGAGTSLYHILLI